jgi:tetratricopeptide (TPR) repeat protein
MRGGFLFLGDTLASMLRLMNKVWSISACALFAAGTAFPQNSGDLEHYADEGQQALAAGQYDIAQRDFEELRKLQPGVAEIHATLAAIYFQQKEYTQAVTEVKTAQRLKPSLPRLDSLLGVSLSELGRFSEALPGLEKGFHQQADPAVQRMCGLQLIRAYTGLDKNDKAVEVGLELNNLYPNDPEVLYQTGKIYGNFAFLTMQKLYQVAPDSVWKHLTAAEAFESENKYYDALTEYHLALQIDPNRPEVHYRIGRTLLSRSQQSHSPQDLADAMTEFEEELKVNPENANAAYEVAEMHRSAGQIDQSLPFYEEALKYYPDFEEAQLGLAAGLMSLQKPDQALPHLRKAVTLNATDEIAWYRLSQAERSLGNTGEQQKALAEFRKLHSANPNQVSQTKNIFSPKSDVTKQTLDQNAPQ